MGKFVGLVGAVTTVGAVAYLMAPLPLSPTSTSDLPTPISAARSAAPATKLAVASKSHATSGPSSRPVSAPPTPRGEPTAVLVQQIQAELHRLGCYDGAIDGQWTDATQRAMQTLGEHVSVLRPVDTPDYIMLALARSQASTVCASTQRTAAARSYDKWTKIAVPEIARPGKGELRPTNGTTRVAASEPDRSSASEPQRVWRAVPDVPPKRGAVRDESNLIELRKRTATAMSEVPPTPVANPADQPAPSSALLPDTTRMGLGVAPGDPLQAHIDPRNPNAPAILRGPPQPLPGFASQTGDRPAVNEAVPQSTNAAIASPPATSAAPLPHVASKQAKRVWQRTVFTNMQFNGP